MKERVAAGAEAPLDQAPVPHQQKVITLMKKEKLEMEGTRLM